MGLKTPSMLKSPISELFQKKKVNSPESQNENNPKV